MLPRFYAPDLRPTGSFRLPAEESRHLTTVLRLGVGAQVRVFDGRGAEYLARVDAMAKHGVTLTCLEKTAARAELSVRVTLAQAVLKGDKMDTLVRDATMLGIAALQPVVSARSNVSLAVLDRGRAVDRWHRIAIASAKQSRRAVVPEIHAPSALEAFLGAGGLESGIMLVEPDASSESLPAGVGLINAAALAAKPKPSSITIASGPEGGWTDAELAGASRAGLLLLTLGRGTLRADAAPIVGLSVLQYIWGDL